MSGIVLLGGGGHCRAVLGVLERLGEYEVHGISDLAEMKGQHVLPGYPIDLVDSDLEKIYPQTRQAFVSLGDKLILRRTLYRLATDIGYVLPALISPTSFVSRHAQVGPGALVMHGAVVSTASRVGANAILNTGSIVEHDCEVGDHSHIAPGAVLCGRVWIGELTLVGANSVVLPGVRIGHHVVLGAGSVVTKDVPDNVYVAGNPARLLSQSQQQRQLTAGQRTQQGSNEIGL